MQRPLTRILLVLLILVSAFAGWTWFRPYEWRPDPAARFRILQSRVSRDHGYAWLDVYLQRTGEALHDPAQPILLKNPAGRTYAPADTTLSSQDGESTTDILVRFWLESGDLDTPLSLQINGGTLRVKSTAGAPKTGTDGKAVYISHSW